MTGGAFGDVSVELAEICVRLKNHPQVPDVLRGFELVFGAPPPPDKPIVEAAEELYAALSLMIPEPTPVPVQEEPHVQKSTSQLDAKGKPGLTAGELRDFLSGLAPATVPTVRIFFGGGVKSIKAEEKR